MQPASLGARQEYPDRQVADQQKWAIPPVATLPKGKIEETPAC
jgi:hypothetical protein